MTGGYFAAQAMTRDFDEMTSDRLFSVARMLATDPRVKAGFLSDNPSEVLQPLTVRMASLTGLDLVVFFDMKGIRYAHTNPDLIGKTFTGGDEGPALGGNEYASKAEGISGPSMRVFVPVYDSDRKQIGVVVAGMLLRSLSREMQDILVDMAAIAMFGLGVGVIGAAAVAYNIKRSILGLEPSQIAAILEERMAILESVREGVMAVDKNSRITIINKEAQRLMKIDDEAMGRKVVDIIPTSRLPEIVSTGRSEFDQEQTIEGNVILTNRVPIIVKGKVVGAVATFRDMSEMRELATQLTGVTQLADTLRAQAHEFINRLHTVSGLLQLGRNEDAVQYIASATKSHEELVGFVTKRVYAPALAGLLLGKISAGNERGITLSLDPDSYVPARDDRLKDVDLITLVGNLVENAFDAVANLAEDRRNVWICLYSGEEEMVIEVEDTGEGIADENRSLLFQRGFTTKPGSKGIGLSLVMHEVAGAHGTIDVDSRVGIGTRFTVRLPRTGLGW